MATQEYRRAHYQANKAAYIASSAESKARAREWFRALKENLVCTRCSESHPACIEFHHRDPTQKDFTIGEALGRKSKQRIVDEIAKCDVLCSNCHRKLHYEEEI